MKKLFIIAGHGGEDPGAGQKYKEADLAIEFRDLLMHQCKVLGLNPITDANTNNLSRTMAWLKSIVFQPTDIMVDIHWNAGPPTATGTEVIIPDNYTSKEMNLAKDVFAVLSKYWRPRRILTEGQTPRKKLGIFRPNMEQILLEVCFISNTQDMATYEKVKYSLAKEIAQVLYRHMNTQAPVQDRIYTVKAGDTLFKISKETGVSADVIIRKNNIVNGIIRIGQKLIL